MGDDLVMITPLYIIKFIVVCTVIHQAKTNPYNYPTQPLLPHLDPDLH